MNKKKITDYLMVTVSCHALLLDGEAYYLTM
jgi:hypothetical protein